ncbi:aquaporin [Mesoplasma photuris]|uniref:aquaporin n=1 Tax=Mesoplasma photuris TaxID=217731 RepID=UPI0004E0C4D8|nr:aquaporin [Mesoplasma photuris]
MENWYIHFLSEFVGSFLLVLIGSSMMLNLFLKGTLAYKEKPSSLHIAFGWASAVVVAVVVGLMIGGRSHINFAITIVYIISGWENEVGPYWMIPVYFAAQAAGFTLGYAIVTLLYFSKMKENAKEGLGKMLIVGYASGTTSKSKVIAGLNEFISMFIFLIAFVFMIGNYNNILAPGVSFIFLFIIVLAISFAFSSMTTSGINPIKDLVGRTFHHALKIEGKGSSNWSFAWIPVTFTMLAGVVVGIGLKFLG